jgi:hypothetical protein
LLIRSTSQWQRGVYDASEKNATCWKKITHSRQINSGYRPIHYLQLRQFDPRGDPFERGMMKLWVPFVVPGIHHRLLFRHIRGHRWQRGVLEKAFGLCWFELQQLSADMACNATVINFEWEVNHCG